MAGCEARHLYITGTATGVAVLAESKSDKAITAAFINKRRFCDILYHNYYNRELKPLQYRKA